MGKYFGTDGFRGEAGITLTSDHAYKVGRFLGWYYNALRERNGDTEAVERWTKKTKQIRKQKKKKIRTEAVLKKLLTCSMNLDEIFEQLK